MVFQRSNAIRATPSIPKKRTFFLIQHNLLRVYLVFTNIIGITVQRLTAYAMNRGTLMVLKRLIVTTLGAFGMGALLAVGTASAQQIPAPDAYGDPQACAASIKAVTAAADTGEVQDNGLTAMQQAALTNMAQSCAGDVGGGIAKARTLYAAAVDAAAELKAAEKAYEDDDSARNLEKRDEARTAHMEAVAARNDYAGGGAIYEAVYAEEDRLAAATAAESAYGKAEMAAQAAETLRDKVELDDYINAFAGFDDTGQAYEFVTVRVKVDVDSNGEQDTDPETGELLWDTLVQVKKQGGATVGRELAVDGGGAPILEDGNNTYRAPQNLTITEGADEDGNGGTVTSTSKRLWSIMTSMTPPPKSWL